MCERVRNMDKNREEEHEIVIVGGGLCGLATALALHRKGMRSVVLERAETLRASGGALGIFANGWRALHQLGIASHLIQLGRPIHRIRNVWLDKGSTQEIPFDEARWLKRSDLIETLAGALPPGTIHFGRQVVSVELDPYTSYPTLQLVNGDTIVSKVVIGCDGANSVVADFVGLKPTKEFGLSVVRGLTNYPNGHSYPNEFVAMMTNDICIGRIPVGDKLVYWFVTLHMTSKDYERVSHRPVLIRESTVHSTDGFPIEVREMIECSDLSSLSVANLRYRTPWELLWGKFRKGTVIVAGDAMHVMGPFLAQGGSAALEDAVVLARCLSHKMSGGGGGGNPMVSQVGEAMDQFVRERRMRVLWLSTQTYLAGLLQRPTSQLLKLVAIVFMAILFADPMQHTIYDCGLL